MKRYLAELIPPGVPLPARGNEYRLYNEPACDMQPRLEARFGRWRSRRRSRMLEVLAEEMAARQAFFDARTQAVESAIKAREAEYRFHELPQLTFDGNRYRQQERDGEYRVLQDRQYLAELQQAIARIDEEIGIMAARQRRGAKRELGFAVEHKKHRIELLDAELAIAERHAVLRDHLRAFASSGDQADELSEMEELLHETRAQLRASGLDTTRLDEEIARLEKQRLSR